MYRIISLLFPNESEGGERRFMDFVIPPSNCNVDLLQARCEI